MTPDPRHRRLIEALDRFGGDFSRWPEALASEARLALIADPAFRRAWDGAVVAERRMLAARNRVDAAIAASGATARIAAALARPPARSNPRFRWMAAAAIVLAAALGVAAGYLSPPAEEDNGTALVALDLGDLRMPGPDLQ